MGRRTVQSSALRLLGVGACALAVLAGRTSGAQAPMPRAEWKENAGVYRMQFSPDGRTLAVGLQDGALNLWDVATGSRRAARKGEAAIVDSMAFTPDSSTLVTGTYSGALLIWDLVPGTLRRQLDGDLLSAEAVSISADGRSLSALGTAGVASWDIHSGQLRGTKPLQVSGKTMLPQVLSEDGKTAAAPGVDHAIRVWDTASGKLRHTLKGHAKLVDRLAITPDGRTLISGGQDPAVRTWDLTTGLAQAVLKGHTDFVEAVAITRDGKLAASGQMGDGAAIRLWDVPGRRPLRTLPGAPHSLNSLAFSPDGKLLAVGASDTIRLWDLSSK